LGISRTSSETHLRKDAISEGFSDQRRRYYAICCLRIETICRMAVSKSSTLTLVAVVFSKRLVIAWKEITNRLELLKADS